MMFKKNFLAFVLLLVISCVFQSAIAQEMMSVGLGIGLWKRPVEYDLQSDRIPVDVFFDIDFDKTLFRFRLGGNATEEKLAFRKYSKDWRYNLKTRSLYLAYRVEDDFTKNINVVALGGPAYTSSEFTDGSDNKIDTCDKLGYIAGLGLEYDAEDFVIGSLFQVVTANCEFEGLDIAVGSNQLLITGAYKF